MKNNKRAIFISLLSALLVWQGAALLMGHELILPSPLTALKRLYEILLEKNTYIYIKNSFFSIISGLFFAFLFGLVLAFAANASKIFEIGLYPYMLLIKTVPVASFIILALIWLSSNRLGAFIAFLMGLPIVYNNVLSGLKNLDKKLLEMAKVFNIGFKKRLLAIYLPHLSPYIISACTSAVGLSIKSAIAAELIGASKSTIGAMLYDAKVYILTADLFAWTLLIVILSLALEKLIIYLLKKLVGTRRTA